VEVIAPVPYFPSWIRKTKWQHLGQVPRQEEIDGVRVHHPRFPLAAGISMPVHGVLEFLGSLRLARRLHKENPFDCIDAHFVYPDGFAAVLLGRALGLPVVVSARGTDINVYPSFRMIRPMLLWTLRHADGAIAVSADLKKKMADLGAAANLVVISNGVDEERFRRLDAKESRRRLALPEEAPIAVSVGSLIESKGHHLLISAVEQLTGQFPKLRLYIIGEGVYRPRLEDLVRGKGLQDRVFLKGNFPNEELATWFSAAEISCLMSSREGWPNVVSESLACGTPVLATPAGGIPEIIASPDLGMLVERDVGSIATGLEQALHHQWDREKIAQRARMRSWKTVASEVESFLNSSILRYGTNHPVKASRS
jgi:glycosyltransferase involved in cell wall biosynthesis